MKNLKQQVYEHCVSVAKDKVDSLRKLLEEVVEITKNETKSSVGDKHETARALLQIEQDNIRKQLHEALQQKAALEQISLHQNTTYVIPGSLVKTDRGFFFVSIAIGKVSTDEFTVIALSPQSPLGSKMLGKKITDSLTINSTRYTIESIG